MVWAEAVDTGRYLAGDSVSSAQGRRPSDWRLQDLAARPGQRGCAHPYSGRRAPHRSDVGTPAIVVLALFLCPFQEAMLEETNMPRADVTVRVLIVDDQASFRRAACSVIELTPGFVVVGEAETDRG